MAAGSRVRVGPREKIFDVIAKIAPKRWENLIWGRYYKSPGIGKQSELTVL